MATDADAALEGLLDLARDVLQAAEDGFALDLDTPALMALLAKQLDEAMSAPGAALPARWVRRRALRAAAAAAAAPPDGAAAAARRR